MNSAHNPSLNAPKHRVGAGHVLPWCFGTLVMILMLLLPQIGTAQQGQSAQSLDQREGQQMEAHGFGKEPANWTSPMEKMQAKIAAKPEKTHGRMWPVVLLIVGLILTLLWAGLLVATISAAASGFALGLLILTIVLSPLVILGIAMIVAGIVRLTK